MDQPTSEPASVRDVLIFEVLSQGTPYQRFIELLRMVCSRGGKGFTQSRQAFLPQNFASLRLCVRHSCGFIR